MNDPLSSLSDNLRIDKSRCVACGICVERCILDNIRLLQAPCVARCPLGINAQGYVQLIARGDMPRAMSEVYEKLPFPGIIGRICSMPCEEACNRRNVDGAAVAIRSLKRYLYDRLETMGPDLSVAFEQPGRVAIIGTGPAGMLAAWDLRKAGCQVTMYDANPAPGGMFWQTIPEFRLPKSVVRREFGYLVSMGVSVFLGVRVGRDVPFADLVRDYDAVFVATGASHSATLGIEGESAEGVWHAVAFLQTAIEKPAALNIGKRVVVIGGGDVAIDAAETALRAGAESVRLVTLEQLCDMPARRWAIDEAQAHGIIIECGWGPRRFFLDGSRVHGVELCQCTSVFDRSGVFNPTFRDEVRRSLEADTVIVAIGQRSDLGFMEGSGVKVEDNRVAIDRVTRQSSHPKVFAGGDIAPGANAAVLAMADGRVAAESILRMLRGEDMAFGRDYAGPVLCDFEVDLSGAAPQPRIDLSQRTVQIDLHDETEFGMTEEQAMSEAGRCLNCGHPVGRYRTCWICLPCEIECPYDALRVEVPFLMR